MRGSNPVPKNRTPAGLRAPRNPARRLALLLVALTAAAAPAAAQAPRQAPGASPDAYAREARQLGDTVVVRGTAGRRLDEYLTRAAPFGFSGVVLAADSTGIVLHQGYGLASRSPRRALDPADIFDMGSIVKGFTGAALVLLEHEGRLSASDPLSRFFPDVPADKANITIHQLLTHTSGIVMNVAGDYDAVPRDSAVRLAFQAPLGAAPGSGFHYSNVGFSIVAAIIEKVTGEPWETVMRRRIFDPAGMRFTGYRNPRWDRGRVVHTFAEPVEFGSALDRLEANGGPYWNLLGNGGMLTTAGDLYRFERALNRGDVIPAAAQLRLFSPRAKRSETTWTAYDWWTEWTSVNEMAVHHGSDAPDLGFNGEFRRYPSDRSVIILLANNRLNGTSIRRYLMDDMRRAILDSAQSVPPPVHAAPRAELLPLRGRYVVDSASAIVVDTLDGHLTFHAVGQGAVDALTFHRAPASLAARRKLNNDAVNFVHALEDGRRAELDSIVGDTAAARALAAGWQGLARERGALTGVEVLGTARLDRGQFLTTVRLRFARGPVTTRFAWAGGRPVQNSEDGNLPMLAGPLPVSPLDAALLSPYWWSDGQGGFLTYDLASDQLLRASFRRAASGAPEALILHTPDAEVVAVRAAGGATRR